MVNKNCVAGVRRKLNTPFLLFMASTNVPFSVDDEHQMSEKIVKNELHTYEDKMFVLSQMR